MDRSDAEWLLKNFKVPMVKQHPRGRPGHAVWQKCQLVSIKNDHTAIVKPWGHKREEEAELVNLVKWNSWTPGEPPPLATKPLTVSIGEIMNPHAANGSKRSVGNPNIIPGKPKEEYFAAKYTPGQWAEAKKLKLMGKKVRDIVVITGIPEGSLYPFFQKEGLAKKIKPRVYKAKVVQAVPVVVAPVAPVAPIAPVQAAAGDDKLAAIRAVLSMPLGYKSKCLMIEGLVSHD